MHAFPQTEATDIDSVADALDSGLVHWVKGETVEALRCLRAATTAACVAGIDQRALDLARAAADLAPEQAPDPIEESKVRRSQSAEPRRSKLPEPPATPKKFTGSPEADALAATSNAASIRPSTNGNGQPSNPPSQGASNAPTSAKSTRPSSFAARPSSAKAANNASVSAKSVSSPPGNGAASKPPTAVVSATSANNTAAKEHEPSATTTIAASTSSTRLTNGASNESSSSKVPPNGVQPTLSIDARTATRSSGNDLRLASIRVRIDRIEPDGTICLRQLDLAATASGEDNAMLVLNQSLWQELKRGS